MRASRKVGVATIIGSAALVVALAGAGSARQRGDDAAPWTPGRCYRASFLDPAQQQTLRVLDNPVGAFVRVQSDPRSPRVPGVSPRGRVWLNTATVFALEEVECSSVPGN
jgi:hypothetical protein